ncbi:MAG TPA: hypothetical protein VN957_13100 [Chthoniobacterales bacterium]|nr:hypothetical protein [Chthoniobacterales bacterium]
MEIKCHFKNYVTAPNMYDDNWVGYIQKKEKEYGNIINQKQGGSDSETAYQRFPDR